MVMKEKKKNLNDNIVSLECFDGTMYSFELSKKEMEVIKRHKSDLSFVIDYIEKICNVKFVNGGYFVEKS